MTDHPSADPHINTASASAAQPIGEASGASICFGGHDFTLLSDRALFWPHRRALIVADLHFEKGSAFAAIGQHLPPYDSHDILERLELLARTTNATSIYCLGDSFHDPDAISRMDAGLSERLTRLARAHHIIWIAGNHDGLSGGAWGGTVADELCLDGIVLRHESRPDDHRPEISGHFHPKLRLRIKGRNLSRPCFLKGENRLLMPAFGTYTGGLDAAAPEIARLFHHKAYDALLASADRALSFPIRNFQKKT